MPALVAVEQIIYIRANDPRLACEMELPHWALVVAVEYARALGAASAEAIAVASSDSHTHAWSFLSSGSCQAV